MRTEDLIRTLAADARPVRPLAAVLAFGLVPATLLAILAVRLVLGFRPDLAQAALDPVSAARWVVPLFLAALALPLALRLARPEGAASVRLRALLLPALVAGGLVLWALWTTPAQGWGMAWTGKTMVYCLVSIPSLSVLTVGAVFFMLRHGATTAPTRAGAVAGLSGGGLAAAAYALHCTEDSPLFYVSWYGLAILAVTAASAWLGPRVLRW